jgi:histidinol-phosphate aminotransferase
MINWLSEELDRISKHDNYIRPKKVRNVIRLDANENLVLDKKFLSEIAVQTAKTTDLREYPLEQFDEIYKQLAKYNDVNEKYLAVGNGSDQILELILSTIGRGRRATVFTPTFSYFINRCELHGIGVDSVPLSKEDNNLYKKEFLESAYGSDIVYICSPNNPTGNQFDKQIVLEILDSLQDKLILVDEAYVEFADYSLTTDVIKYDNVIALRTLSKAFGLAGARIGYLVASDKFAHIFRSRIQSPYPLSSLSLAIASVILSNFNYVKESIELIKKERKRVFDQISEINVFKSFRSDANFLFFEFYDRYYSIIQALEREKLIVKALGDIDDRKGCIRVTIGTREINDIFLETIQQTI